MNYKKYLETEGYNWKDLFIFLVDDGYMNKLIRKMIKAGLLKELDRNQELELIDYLIEELRKV